MAGKYQAFPGMDDLVPGQIEKWQWLEEKARVFFEARGFKEIRTPLLEPTELFARSIGEASDIVHKEMYTLTDRGDRSMTLRPEMTASVARAVIEKGLLTQAKSLRLYYLGPMFRAERPQAGRKRQFHQIGIEIINEAGVAADFECIRLVYDFLDFVGVANPGLRINDLGGPEKRARFAEAVKAYFSRESGRLCEDCRWRLEKNVLRIFDCKVHSCQPVINAAPWDEIAPLSESFEALMKMFADHRVPFQVERRLVRGLDYYNGPVFEVTAQGLGAQDAVAGGGRYDRLYAELGGPETPCTGFSLGMERVLTVLEKQGSRLEEKIRVRRIYLAGLAEEPGVADCVRRQALRLREEGFRVEMTPGEVSLSRHLKKANHLGLRFVMIAGPDEIKKGKWILKDMEKKTQSELAEDELISCLKGAVLE